MALKNCQKFRIQETEKQAFEAIKTNSQELSESENNALALERENTAFQSTEEIRLAVLAELKEL